LIDPQLVQLSVVVLVAVAVGGIAYVLLIPYLSGEKKGDKRLAQFAKDQPTRRSRGGDSDLIITRKKEVQETLKELEARQKSKKKATLKMRLARAGFDVTPRSFYMASLGLGVGTALLMLITGSAPLLSLAAGVSMGLGMPRWLVNFLGKRRQKRFLRELANAIDIIVRGVKSGLPLNDCLHIIAVETPEPVREEFEKLVEQQKVGIPLAKAFEGMLDRVPLPEVNFFSIVVSIQQKTGGNLAEALGNLAAVLRDRQRLAGKVAAFSAEAKTSAAIIGALPPLVMLMLFMSTPDYVAILWTDRLGKIMLMASGFWMLCGVLVMRKMINFDY
jgi:tight adherence protein B